MSVYDELEMTFGSLTKAGERAAQGAFTVLDTAAAGLAPAVAAAVNAPGKVVSTVARGAGRMLGLNSQASQQKRQSKP
ncbi:hypothetical protein LO772_22470 [Yinghuangia sp. ASG 101]|uniref:hypothetical protein n=1 Tax=Yinghuangia sp. ASG 101 TaxID=2896848 RepID=UPI001E40A554|nr:hypothetical protein [Yinghuangia sp. ASG 101]UGQ09670.1 hypothetical protein LO772_22470 [Yinghuangia sp. ASG 101]